MENIFYAAICDDEEIYINQICSYLAAYESESGNTLIIDRYSSARTLLRVMQEEKKQYDILFLDVDMPDMQGIDAAVEIRKFDTDSMICFVTSYEDYAYRAFKVDAAGYLLKPVKYKEFKQMADKCTIQIQYKKDRDAAEERYFHVVTAGNGIIIRTRDIMYIEKKRNQCLFHLREREISSYDTLAHVYEQLDHHLFHYSHQGYIVNLDYIDEVTPNCVYLQGILEVPVSRRYYKELREIHMDKVNRILAEYHAEIDKKSTVAG